MRVAILIGLILLAGCSTPRYKVLHEFGGEVNVYYPDGMVSTGDGAARFYVSGNVVVVRGDFVIERITEEESESARRNQLE